MIFVLGSKKYTFSAGVSNDMPFFGVCELKDGESSGMHVDQEAQSMIEKFSKEGVVVYFENQMAAENFSQIMAFIFSRAAEVNDWPEDGSREAMQ